jgi:FMN phosphatase YigB (HAD superfamily)
MIRALFVDLDDKLYAYAPSEQAGREAMRDAVCASTGISADAFDVKFKASRERVKARCDSPSGHSRLLYAAELAQDLPGAHHLEHVRDWERAYWGAYIAAATLRPGAKELLQGFRARGGKVAIVTDLVLEVQLWKLSALDLLSSIDALVASEEVGVDKPALAPFLLAAERIGVSAQEGAVIGDSDDKDGGGARALGVPFFLVRSTDAVPGDTLPDIARAIERTNGWTR